MTYDRINYLIETIFNDEKEKEKQEKIISDAKEKATFLDANIQQNKRELLVLLNNDPEPFKSGNMVAITMHRNTIEYNDEKAIIKWLKENLNNKFVKTKTTESLDKVPFKKELKINENLANGVKDYVNTYISDYVVVTDENNYQKMLEHIGEDN